MPNRIIKESIKKSATIDKLKPFEEVVFYRMIVTADDYGRLDGRIIVLKNELFPTKEDVTKKSIEDAITQLVKVDLVRCYEVDGIPYLYMPTWGLHQQIRAKKSKYPEPNNNGNHLISNDSKCLRNPIQSESEYESNLNPTTTTQPGEKVVFELPIDSGVYKVTQEKVDTWQKLYPKTDIMQELRNMLAWINVEPKRPERIKTIVEIEPFIIGWFTRNVSNYREHNTVNKPRKKVNFPQREYTDNDYSDMERKMMQKAGGI